MCVLFVCFAVCLNASEVKDLLSQVIAYALSILLPLLFASFCWFVPRCEKDPSELEHWRTTRAIRLLLCRNFVGVCDDSTA